jgi:hypothetical protein
VPTMVDCLSHSVNGWLKLLDKRKTVFMFNQFFYTYAYLDKNGSPYYIGKGQGTRAYMKHDNTETPHISQILILKSNLTEQEALKHEEYMISIYGRKHQGLGILDNKFERGHASSIQYKKEDPDKWADSLICSIFGNKTAACVLLFIDKNEDAHATRIAKTFGFGLNQTQRQLKRLEQNYILQSRRIGLLRLYSFNRSNPTVKRLRIFLSEYMSTVLH